MHESFRRAVRAFKDFKYVRNATEFDLILYRLLIILHSARVAVSLPTPPDDQAAVQDRLTILFVRLKIPS